MEALDQCLKALFNNGKEPEEDFSIKEALKGVSPNMPLNEILEKQIKIYTPCDYKEIVCGDCGETRWPVGAYSPFERHIFHWYAPKEFCSCPKGKRLEEEYNQNQGRIKREAAEAKVNAEEKRKIDRLFAQSKMGERFKNRTFDNFNVTPENRVAFNNCKKYAEAFKNLKNGVGLILTGGVGTGKTHLVAAVANKLITNHVPVVFGTLVSLLDKVKQSYQGKGQDEWEILDLYSTVNLLIIDDLGKERPTEWTLEKLYSIVNDRYERLRPIIVTTNFEKEALIDRLTTKENSSTAEAVVSRIFEMCPGLNLSGKDYRMK